MQGPFKTPDALAKALLAGPVTPERITRLLWHARKGTRPAFAGTLAALPPAVRATVEAAGDAAAFRG